MKKNVLIFFTNFKFKLCKNKNYTDFFPFFSYKIFEAFLSYVSFVLSVKFSNIIIWNLTKSDNIFWIFIKKCSKICNNKIARNRKNNIF